MDNEHDEIATMVREDLKAFLIKVFEMLNPGQTFRDNWHIDAICHQLALCYIGKTKRLIITLPPRHLKSLCSSIAFVLWFLGKRPYAHIICASYSEDLAVSFANERRKLMQTKWYKKVFPNARISKTKNTETETVITKGGRIVSTSVGGTLTGKGGNLIIIDDPIKADDAMSDVERKRVNDWFRNTVYTRLNDPKNDIIVIVMQRVHMNDLVGEVLELEEWEVLDLPSIAQEDQEIEIDEGVFYHRKEGDVLHPEHCDLAELEKRRAILGSPGFSAQYLQRPVPPGGVIFLRKWFRSFDPNLIRHRVERIWQSWDTASQVNDWNCYSVCLTFGVIEGRVCLLHVYRDRLEYPALRAKIIKHAQNWGAERVLIEKASTGLALLQDIIGKTHFSVIPFPVRGDKITRAEQASAIVEAGRVFLPEDAPWLADFLKEVLAFPGSKYDDQVDALSQILWYLDHCPKPPVVTIRSIGDEHGMTYYDRMGGHFPF